MNKLLLFATITTLFFSCGKNPVNSYLLQTKIIIDGDASDWESTPAQIIQEDNASMRVLNDSESLYVLFQTTDTELAQKAFRTGFKIWFDKKKKRGVAYRGSFNLADSLRSLMALNSEDEQSPNRPANRMAEFGASRGPLAVGRIVMQTNDYKNSFGENEQETLQASAKVKHGIYCYEFKIPLVDFDGLPFVPKIDDDTIANIGLEIGGIDGNMRKKMANKRSSIGGRPAGGMGGGRGGMGGRSGGMGGRGGGGMRPTQRPDMEADKIWFKIKLSQENN